MSERKSVISLTFPEYEGEEIPILVEKDCLPVDIQGISQTTRDRIKEEYPRIIIGFARDRGYSVYLSTLVSKEDCIRVGDEEISSSKYLQVARLWKDVHWHANHFYHYKPDKVNLVKESTYRTLDIAIHAIYDRIRTYLEST